MRWTRPTVQRMDIMVVVSETVTGQEFTTYMRDLFFHGFLSSVYFDEAHMLRTEVHFHHKFESFRRLALSVPWIFLTATLPPMIMKGFEESLELTKSRPKYI